VRPQRSTDDVGVDVGVDVVVDFDGDGDGDVITRR
jgi:hypothetical protein